jgi:ABC-type multidrug transport system fused ATPase/permease subunit
MTLKPNTSVIKKIWSLLSVSEHRKGLILLFLMMISTGLEILGIGLIIPTISLLTNTNLIEKFPILQPFLEFIGNPDQATLVIYGMLSLVFIYALKNLFLAFFAWVQAKYTFDIQIRLSQYLFELYLRRPYTFHLQRNSAQLFRNITGEVGMFSSGINTSIMLISEILVMFGISILLIMVEPLGTIIVVSVLGFAGWCFNHISKRHIVRWGEERQYHEGLRIQHLQQGLGGVKDVKILGREFEFLEQYRKHNILSARTAVFQKILQALPRLWLELLAVCGLTTLVLTMLSKGREFDSILPVLAVFTVAGFRIMPSVSRMLNSIQTLRFSLPVIDVLYKEINFLVPFENNLSKDKVILRNELNIQKVSYTYPNANKPSLLGVSLKIKQGESIGIIGSSGSGKTTLADLLLGLLTPDEGKVLVDDKDIQCSIRTWQDQIGYVPQSIYLTDDTLRRNVAFGISNENIDADVVWHAIRAAQLDEFVKTLPMGLDTIIGEHGVRLSGGQRQRIGIARALYHDPSVLILDEATSALDMQTEHGVMEAVRALKGKKMIIIVAHRLSTVESCDRLYEIEDGRLIQEGIPEKILSGR